MLVLDRAPKAKTLRRKLAHLGSCRTKYPVRPSFGLTTGRPARERLWVSTTATVRIIGIEKSSACCRMAEARLFKMRSESGI